MRVFGVSLVVVGVALAIVSFQGLSDASEMGRFMAEAGEAFGQRSTCNIGRGGGELTGSVSRSFPPAAWCQD